MEKFTIEDFKGVIPAMLTPFTKDEEIDEAGIRDLTEYLLSFNIGGLYLTGSTGETFLMNEEERKKVLEIVMDQVAGRVPVVAHIGTLSTKAAIELAKHAESLGVAGISSVPPFYWRHSEEAIINYYKDIVESVDLPMIVYNIPLAGLMSVDTIKKLAELKNVCGVKFTSTTLFEITQIKDATPEGFMIFGGADELASSNLAIGVDGIIGSFYNLIPDLFIQIRENVKNGNQAKAEELQRYAVRIIMDVLKHGSMVGAMKSILRKAGIEAGYSRRPFLNFEDERQKEVVNSLLSIENIKDLDLELINRLK
ncbi:N-acetylneuraminate lyase [Helcococcus kunzii]